MKIFEVVAEEMPENHSKSAEELAIFVSDFLVEDELQWKNGRQQSERKFIVDSEYLIRFYVALTVLEI